MPLLNEFQVLTSKISSSYFYLSRNLDVEKINNSRLLTHIKLYPKIEWRDVYKFIFQGTCGWTHLLTNRNQEQIIRYLNDELTRASKPLPHERLYELLNDDTKICRINLRIWKNNKIGKIHELWNLIESSSKAIPKTTDYFTKDWLNLIELVDNEALILSEKNIYLVNEWLNVVLKLSKSIKESKDMPLLHHSETYRENYHPSYRLVIEDELLEFVKQKNIEI